MTRTLKTKDRKITREIFQIDVLGAQYIFLKLLINTNIKLGGHHMSGSFRVCHRLFKLRPETIKPFGIFLFL